MLIREHAPTQWGTPVSIELTPNDVAIAIDAYCVAKGIHVQGPRTISMDGKLLRRAVIYVDPSGFVVRNGVRYPQQPSNSDMNRSLRPITETVCDRPQGRQTSLDQMAHEVWCDSQKEIADLRAKLESANQAAIRQEDAAASPASSRSRP